MFMNQNLLMGDMEQKIQLWLTPLDQLQKTMVYVQMTCQSTQY